MTTEPPNDPLSLLEKVRDLECRLAEARRAVVGLADSGVAGELWALRVVSGGQPFLVPVASIREVLPVPMPTPMADAPVWVMGTFSFAGVTVPMVDVGCRVTGRPSRLLPELRVVVCDWPSWLGLVVDEVGDVVRLDPSQLSPPPAEVRAAAFVVALGDADDGAQATVLSPARIADELDV